MRFISLILVLFLFATPATAQEKHATVRLFSPITALGPENIYSEIPVGIDITLEEGWKTYWRMPGDSGLAPVFDWTGSENFSSARINWPAPKRFVIYGMDNIGYERGVMFPVDIKVADRNKPLNLRLTLDILVCNDICVPEKHMATLTLPPGKFSDTEDMAMWEADESIPLSSGGDLSFDKAWLDVDAENKIDLVAEAQILGWVDSNADLFVEHASGIPFGRPEIHHDTTTKTAVFRAPVHSTDPLDKLNSTLSAGRLTLTYVPTDGNPSIETSLALSSPPQNDAATVKKKSINLDPYILLLAVLGGLVLNLMPCVLPVLSLKVLSIASHGGHDSRAKIFRNFMASAAGILFSFLVMAAGLIVLKAAGKSVGWGIQFQHPWFLGFLIALLLLFAANLWDIFEIPLPRFVAKNIPARHEHEPTLIGHFLTGAFATLLATPCTAPFLGTAVGFALARGSVEILAVFTCLGLGLALPYMLLAVSPGLFRYMPKPGPWMVRLKKILAFALLGTAAWLMHVLLVITTSSALDPGWQAFDESLIAPAVSEGRVVIVDVTADWCLTCKANKKFVLEQKDIVAALSDGNILKLQADWTRRDEKIAAYLQKYGRYGIPFNIVYGPAVPEGIPLPELLSKESVLNALTEAAGE